ncbi:MAG TPA: hypothetical protein VFI81_08555, partial [Rhodanobacteraceae bacterium]|nr:hypothetical protein [Rhodanobacteraceae bacterium]
DRQRAAGRNREGRRQPALLRRRDLLKRPTARSRKPEKSLVIPAQAGTRRLFVQALNTKTLGPGYRFATAFAEPVPDLIRELQTRTPKAARSVSAMNGTSIPG